MNNQETFSQAIRLQRAVCRSSLTTLLQLQSSSDLIIQQSMEQCSWMPKESKGLCLYWLENCQKATGHIQDMVEQNFENFENLVFPQPETAEKPKAKDSGTEKTAPKKAPVSRTKSTSAAAAKKPAQKKTPAKKTTAAAKTSSRSAKSTSAAKESTGSAAKTAKSSAASTASAKTQTAASKSTAAAKTPAKTGAKAADK